MAKNPAAIENSVSQKLEDARQSMQLKLVKSLKEYRNLYVVQHRLGGRLIYPESLKFLPLYVLSLCRSTALRGGYADVPLDERCAAGYNIMILPIGRMLKLLYPSLLRIDENLLKVFLSPYCFSLFFFFYSHLNRSWLELLVAYLIAIDFIILIRK